MDADAICANTMLRVLCFLFLRSGTDQDERELFVLWATNDACSSNNDGGLPAMYLRRKGKHGFEFSSWKGGFWVGGLACAFVYMTYPAPDV